MTTPAPRPTLRIGVDLGGTKIEGLVLGPDGRERTRRRIPSPRGAYDATLRAIRDLVAALESDIGATASVGIGIPGSISPATGLVQNANSTWLNGRPLDRDLKVALGREVRLANDANCFALSEAVDGAGREADIVFGIILGTGTGGGIVIGSRLLEGARHIGGEWGHDPLPWASADEHPGQQCWCGRKGCMETWVSGPALAADHARVTGQSYTGEEIAARAAAGDRDANATLVRHASRLARGIAHVANIIDPDVVVLGGGLSELPHLYETLPGLVAGHIFADRATLKISPPVWGATGGARGAAWLWNQE